MKTRPTKVKIAKSQFRTALTASEYEILQTKYDQLPDEEKDNKSINMYLAELFEKQIRKLQEEMDCNNHITLDISHAVTGVYGINLFVFLYPEDFDSLSKLSKYIGFSRVNLFRYLILKELYS